MMENSLAAKLRTLKVGETLYLDDPREAGRPLNKAVMSITARSGALAGRKFSTQHFVAVQTNPAVAKPILAITCVALEA